MRSSAWFGVLVYVAACGDIVKSTDDAGNTDDGAVPGDGGEQPDATLVAPTISAVTPDWGSMTGGTNVKITGSGFSVPGVTVAFGATDATTVTVVSDSELRVVTPAGPHAAVALAVTNPVGTATFGAQYRYLAQLYAADGRGMIGNLYRIDPATAAATTIGSLGAPVTGLALSSDGVLFGNTTTSPARLIRIDPYTAATSTLASITLNGNAGGATDLMFQGSKLLGWRGTSMVEINMATGVETASASVRGGGCGLASTGPTTAVYSPENTMQRLFTVNTANGVATAGPQMNGTTNESINSLTFVGSTLLGSAITTTPTRGARLIAIDPVTGAITNRGALPVNIDALEGIPTQAPIAAVAPTASDASSPADGQLADARVIVDGPTPVAAARGGQPQVADARGEPQVADARGGQPQVADPRGEPQVADARGEPQVADARVIVDGQARPAAEVFARNELRIAGEVRSGVALRTLAPRARSVSVSDGEHTVRLSLRPGLALIANQRGELKLVDTTVGTKKLFGPVRELRFAR